MALLYFGKFDEGSGTSVADSSGNGYTGSFNGGMSWSTWSGRNVVTFAPSASISLASDAILTSFSDITIMVFVNQNASPPTWATILGFNNEDPALFLNSNAPRFYPLVPVADTIGTGSWKHICVTKTGTSYRYYVDGVAYSGNPATGTGGTITPGGSARTIGAGNGAGSDEPFTGSMSYMRVYDEQLDDAEVAAQYAADLPGGGPTGNPWYAYAQQLSKTKWKKRNLIYTPSYAFGEI